MANSKLGPLTTCIGVLLGLVAGGATILIAGSRARRD
jgi:hypothetical protein